MMYFLYVCYYSNLMVHFLYVLLWELHAIHSLEMSQHTLQMVQKTLLWSILAYQLQPVITGWDSQVNGMHEVIVK